MSLVEDTVAAKKERKIRKPIASKNKGLQKARETQPSKRTNRSNSKRNR
jgi:hypothetical protein